MAVELYSETVRDIEVLRSKAPNILSYKEWQEYLCMANFGLGFGKGLLDMKNKTYRNSFRSFHEIGSIVRGFDNACSQIKIEPLNPRNHFNLGTSYGSLGLAKEGKNMLEILTYWDNIRTYIKEDDSLK